jgi:transposase
VILPFVDVRGEDVSSSGGRRDWRMNQRILLPDAIEVKLEFLQSTRVGGLIMVLRANREQVCCPSCGIMSRRVHSRYLRKLSDLPWEGIAITIHLRTRKFFCDSDQCRRRIFTEPFPNTVGRYARRTNRAVTALDWITLSLGGEAGARLARRLGLFVDGSTLLRKLRHKARSYAGTAPRVLGIDDWAWRKGHRYGTILCDLEQHKVIDLLPDRDTASVEQWLRSHPGTEIVSRDRASAYSDAVNNAAPEAIQVADRWHLLRNLSEALRQALEPHHRMLTTAARVTARRSLLPTPCQHEDGTPAISKLRHESFAKQQNRERRHARYESVMELVRNGVAKKQIARQLGLDRRTVRHWIQSGSFPERKTVHHRSSADLFASYLDQRWQQGCRNAAQLWREIRERGFRGQVSQVRRWIQQRYGLHSNRPELPSKPSFRASPRHTAWLLLTEPKHALRYLDELYSHSELLARTAAAAREFVRIIRNRDISAWPAWQQLAQKTWLAGFAANLARDQNAVMAALNLPWSNGQVEGQVHRLKLLKRQMYGRAGFELLRLRVLNAA